MGREVGKSPANPPSPPTSEPGRGWSRGTCGQAEGSLPRGLNHSSSSPSHGFWNPRITREAHQAPETSLHGVSCMHKPPAWLGLWPRRGCQLFLGEAQEAFHAASLPGRLEKGRLPDDAQRKETGAKKKPSLGRGGSTTSLQGGGSRGRELKQRLWLTAAHPAPWGFRPAFLMLGANVAQPRPG